MTIDPDNSDRLFESLREWILALPGVTEAPHRFGGAEFRVKGMEFMHLHGPSFLDIRLSMDDQGGCCVMARRCATVSPRKLAG